MFKKLSNQCSLNTMISNIMKCLLAGILILFNPLLYAVEKTDLSPQKMDGNNTAINSNALSNSKDSGSSNTSSNTPKSNDSNNASNNNPTNSSNSSVDNGTDTSKFLTEHPDMQFTFLFPVDDEKITLKIIIPKSFQALESDPNSELLEFIPKTDTDPYKWTEIITLNKILGKSVTAPEYIESLNAEFIKSTKNAKIIEQDKHSYDGYQDASSIIQYNYNDRDEVVIFYSVSGPYDIANVQYALPLPSQDKLNETVQKLKDFTKNNLEIVKK